VKAIVDNAVPAAVLAELDEQFERAEPGRNVFGEKQFRAAQVPIVDHVHRLAGAADCVGAWFVLTRPEDQGSPPHYDEDGPTAVLHLSDVEGGEFLFLDDVGEEAVEFKRNRLVVWSEECQHMHRPPLAGDRRTLVSRFVRR
jgi:hypothetical protein